MGFVIRLVYVHVYIKMIIKIFSTSYLFLGANRPSRNRSALR